jgi:hypothetical protein
MWLIAGLFFAWALWQWLYPRKLVYVIAPVRSMSTGFMRAFMNAGFETFNEPSLYSYDIVHRPEVIKDWYRPDAPKSARAALNLFTRRHNKTCVKEMAYSIGDISRLARRPNTYFILLIRDPASILVSAFGRVGKEWDFDEVLGLRQIFEFYLRLTSAGCKVRVVSVNEVCARPVQTFESIFGWLGVRFDPRYLTWDALGPGYDGAGWHDFKTKQYVNFWHEDAIKSTSLKPLAVHSLDVIPETYHADYAAAHERALPYYTELLRLSKKR